MPRILCNPKALYRVHKSLLFFRNQSQINPIHTLPFCSLKIHFSIITSCVLTSSYLLPSFPLLECELACHMRHQSHLPLFCRIWWAVQTIKLPIMYFSPLPFHLIPSMPRYSPLYPFLKVPQSLVFPLMWWVIWHLVPNLRMRGAVAHLHCPLRLTKPQWRRQFTSIHSTNTRRTVACLEMWPGDINSGHFGINLHVWLTTRSTCSDYTQYYLMWRRKIRDIGTSWL
jgi:hypothetical protein